MIRKEWNAVPWRWKWALLLPVWVVILIGEGLHRRDWLRDHYSHWKAKHRWRQQAKNEDK